MSMRKIFIAMALMAPVVLMAAVAKDYRLIQDRLILGSPAGPDPVIKFQGTTATIKANRTSNTIEFADDGATFKSIGSPVPTQQKFLSGSGTYTPAAGTKWIHVKMVGGGGGGGGGGLNGTAGNGTSGAATSFGSLIAGAGSLANAGASPGGPGGTNTFAGTGLEVPGGSGGGISYNSQGGLNIGGGGGDGGNSCLGGGGGAGSGAPSGGLAGSTNTGGGGGGGGAGSNGANVMFSGPGGGAGGCIEAIVPAPTATAYSVGAGGTGGTAGTAGGSGGNGAAGVLIITEFH